MLGRVLPGCRHQVLAVRSGSTTTACSRCDATYPYRWLFPALMIHYAQTTAPEKG